MFMVHKNRMKNKEKGTYEDYNYPDEPILEVEEYDYSDEAILEVATSPPEETFIVVNIDKCKGCFYHAVCQIGPHAGSTCQKHFLHQKL